MRPHRVVPLFFYGQGAFPLKMVQVACSEGQSACQAVGVFLAVGAFQTVGALQGVGTLQGTEAFQGVGAFQGVEKQHWEGGVGRTPGLEMGACRVNKSVTGCALQSEQCIV
jgi:hypothetical protein